jgi:hypothetical protein
MKKIDVRLTEFHNYYGRTGMYHVEIGKHELDVSQRSAEKLDDMVKGNWDIELDEGKIALLGAFEYPYKPNRCECGVVIRYYRWLCDDCLRIGMG